MGLDFKTDPTSDRADSLAGENRALRAEVARLTAERAAIGSDHHDAISAIRLENYTLRAEVARLTRERDDALIALGRQTYTAPYRELVAWNNGDGPNPRDKTDAEWIAIGRLRLHAVGLAAAPAGEGGAP